VVAQATLSGKTVDKTQKVEATSLKKLNPCPVVGDSFSSDVNGTSFSGTLSSLKKPNKVNVALS